MIQRIQTLYLSIVLMLTMVLVKGTVFSFIDKSGKIIMLMPNGAIKSSDGQVISQIELIWPLYFLIVLILLLSFITIIIYRNMKLQILFSRFVIILSSLLVVALSYYSYFIIDNYYCSIIPGIKLALPLFILLFAILACRGILHDERLLKSYDRLR